MKTNQIFKHLFFTVLLIAISSSSFSAVEKTVEISLPTIQCGMCVKTIEKALKKIDGVTLIDIDVENKKATVKYEDSKTSLETIENAITGAGYGANDKKADQKAYDKLHDCCKVN